MSMMDLVRQLAGVARTLAPIVAGPEGSRVVAIADQLGRTLQDLRDTISAPADGSALDLADIDADIAVLRERVNAHARETLASLVG